MARIEGVPAARDELFTRLRAHFDDAVRVGA
jgi:hypothetical protein